MNIQLKIKSGAGTKCAAQQLQRHENIRRTYELIGQGVATVNAIHERMPDISIETLNKYIIELNASRDIIPSGKEGRSIRYRVLDPREITPDLPPALLILMGIAPYPAPEGKPVEFKLDPLPVKPRRREFSYGVSQMEVGL
jgi:hypothetical protein